MIGTQCYIFEIWRRSLMETLSALQALLMGIHRSSVDSPHKAHEYTALMFSSLLVGISCESNRRVADDLRLNCVHVTSMLRNMHALLRKHIFHNTWNSYNQHIVLSKWCLSKDRHIIAKWWKSVRGMKTLNGSMIISSDVKSPVNVATEHNSMVT